MTEKCFDFGVRLFQGSVLYTGKYGNKHNIAVTVQEPTQVTGRQ
jgi:hypothetical protein